MNTVANMLTAIALLLGAIPLLIKAIIDIGKARSEVKKVHVIVNQQRTDMQRYERALKAALEKAGIEIPVDQSIDPNE
jgi:hypothetical protein